MWYQWKLCTASGFPAFNDSTWPAQGWGWCAQILYKYTLLATCISELGKALLQEISRFLIILPDHGWTGRVCLRARILHDTRSRQISAAGAQPPRCLLASPVLLRRPKCLPACSGVSLQPSKGVVRQFGEAHEGFASYSVIDFCALGREWGWENQTSPTVKTWQVGSRQSQHQWGRYKEEEERGGGATPGNAGTWSIANDGFATCRLLLEGFDTKLTPAVVAG